LDDKSLSLTIYLQHHPAKRDEKAELQHFVTLKSQRRKHYHLVGGSLWIWWRFLLPQKWRHLSYLRISICRCYNRRQGDPNNCRSLNSSLFVKRLYT